MGTVNRPLMNVDDRMGSCRDKGRMWGRVGAWCLSCWQRDAVGTAWSNQVAPQRGQAPGPLIHSTPPLVPTGPWAASTSMDRIPRFGRQHSSGVRIISSMCISSITCRYKSHPSNSTGIPRNYPFLIPQRPVMTTGDSTDALQALAGYTLSKGSSMGARPC